MLIFRGNFISDCHFKDFSICFKCCAVWRVWKCYWACLWKRRLRANRCIDRQLPVNKVAAERVGLYPKKKENGALNSHGRRPHRTATGAWICCVLFSSMYALFVFFRQLQLSGAILPAQTYVPSTVAWSTLRTITHCLLFPRTRLPQNKEDFGFL